MLTIRQNLLETIRGGNPDRFVKQYEFMEMMMLTPHSKRNKRAVKGEPPTVDLWGVTKVFPDNTPGPFPIHTPETIVIKDMENWRDYVKAPPLDYPEEEWLECAKLYENIDRNEKFATFFYVPGIFEQCHYLMEIQNCLMAFYEYPDEMHELIDWIADWEVAYAEKVCKYFKPYALFHHDDWGSQISTFISPAMFEEFYLPAYKRVYGTYKKNGVELIVHHSDSYAATLVPYMIEMGVDIWQGVMKSNNIKNLIDTYGGKISFMGGVDSAEIDYEGWTPEVVAEKVEYACTTFGKKFYIPSASQGGPYSTFPGVYETMDGEIEKMSAKLF